MKPVAVAPSGDDRVRAADERRYIEIVIGQELKNSPLQGTEKDFVKYGDTYKVDPLLAVAIANHESRYCKAYMDSYNSKYHNCSGIMNGGQANGLVSFKSYEEFIEDFVRLLSLYIYQDGRTTISQIGSKYAPVNSHYLNASWTNGVTVKYNELWKQVEAK